MSVVEENKIDAMGKSRETNELLLLITDHLDWEWEEEHLIILQEKINAYLSFIETKQYRARFPKENFDGYVIMIDFQHAITENCAKFLNTVAQQVSKYKITIKINET